MFVAGAAEVAMQHEDLVGERRRDSRRSSLLTHSGWVSHERYLQGAFWLKIEGVASDGVRLMR